MKNFVCKTGLIIALLLVTWFSYAQNTGIGTVLPNARLHVAATATDSVALRVAVNNSTKLKVSDNGGTTIGSASDAPANGLLVKGILQPEDSIKAINKPIYITTASDSVVLQAGTTTIILLANGAVRIKAAGNGGISLDAGNGNVNITGLNVNIKATGGGASLTGTTATIQSSAVTNVYGPLVRLGSSTGPFLPAARQTDQVQVSPQAGNGSIIQGSAVVLIQ